MIMDWLVDIFLGVIVLSVSMSKIRFSKMQFIVFKIFIIGDLNGGLCWYKLCG